MRIFNVWLLTMIFVNAGMSQLQIKLSISRIDSFGRADTALFGVDQRATYCIDTSLGEQEIWWQACALVTCLAFVDVRSGLGACLGYGTRIDLRPYYSPTQLDTYKLKFDGYPPMVFHWQPSIALYYGAMTFMNDRDTNLATVKVNMLAQDSFVITSQLTGFRWYIRAEFPHPVTDVRRHEMDFVAVPVLSQNYPNPFNPTTKIAFSVPTQSFVLLNVYDLLGREVSSVVREVLAPGRYEVPFDGVNLASGIYFYRLHAGQFVQTRKFLLIR